MYLLTEETEFHTLLRSKSNRQVPDHDHALPAKPHSNGTTTAVAIATPANGLTIQGNHITYIHNIYAHLRTRHNGLDKQWCLVTSYGWFKMN